MKRKTYKYCKKLNMYGKAVRLFLELLTDIEYEIDCVLYFSCLVCDQKLASDSSGLPGGFSGQRAWVRILKKWAPGSYCLELVVACPAAGTSAQILLVEGK
jgi:hypothetical protein